MGSIQGLALLLLMGDNMLTAMVVDSLQGLDLLVVGGDMLKAVVDSLQGLALFLVGLTCAGMWW